MWNDQTWDRLRADYLFPRNLIKAQCARTRAALLANGCPTTHLKDRTERSVSEWWTQFHTEVTADAAKEVKRSRVNKLIREFS